MSGIHPPSTMLLRTFLKPSTLPRCSNQLRHSSNYMPRSRYVKVTRLDKLHRTQKAAAREEKLAALQRADAISTSIQSSLSSSLSPGSTQPPSFPFTVTRTPSSQLPVYESAKNGGNKHLTTIRKLSGDLDSLAAEIRTVLKLPEYIVDMRGNKKATVAINRLTRHVIVRGWRGEEVKAWMTAVGF